MPVVNLYFDGMSWCDAVGVFSDSSLTTYYDPGVPTGQAVEIIFNGYKRSWIFSTKTLGPCVSC